MQKIVAIVLFIFLITYAVCAQELSLYTNYLQNNYYNINPAAAGFDGAFITQMSIARKWMGMPESPTSQVFSNSIRMGDEEFYDPDMFLNRPFINLASRVGLGLTFFNETTGPLKHTGGLLAYAYHIALRENRLSFGLSGYLAQYTLDAQKFRPHDKFIQDKNLYSNSSALAPDLNMGVMLYNPKYFIGISVIGLVNLNRVMDETKPQIGMVYSAGHRFKLYGGFVTEPSVCIIKDLKINTTIDINNKLYYQKRNWLLISFRSTGEALAGIGFGFKNGLQFSYSVALSTNALSQYSAGSHCVSLRSDIVKLIRRKGKE